MAHVRQISAAEQPADGDYALIEQANNGKYQVNGVISYRRGAALYRPPGFDSVDDALKDARSWAALAGVPVIYVRQ